MATEIILKYPYAEGDMRCPWCFRYDRPTGMRTTRAYGNHTDLLKHIRRQHTGTKVSWECGACGFVGSGAYPLKSVRAHYADRHWSPGAAGSRGPSRGQCVIVRTNETTTVSRRSPVARSGTRPTAATARFVTGKETSTSVRTTTAGIATCVTVTKAETRTRTTPIVARASPGRVGSGSTHSVMTATTVSSRAKMIRRAENGAENSPSTSAMPAPAPSRAKPRVVSNVRLEWAYVGTAIDAQRTTTATAAGITGTTVTGRRHRDILEGLARFARRRSSGSGATPPLTKSKIPVATGVVRGGLQSIAPSTLTKPPGAPAPSKGLAETTTITSKRQGPSVTSPNSGPSRAARTLPPNNVEPVTLETTHAPVAEGRSMPLIPKNTPPSPGEPACSAVVALTTETIAVSVCGRPRTSPSPRISADTGEGEISSVTPTTPRSPTIPPAPRRNAAHGLSEATEEAANRWSPVPLRSGFRRQRPDFAVAASRARTDPSATPRARPRDTGPTTTSAGNMLRAVALQPAPSTVQTPPRGQTSAGVAAPYTRPDGGVETRRDREAAARRGQGERGRAPQEALVHVGERTDVRGRVSVGGARRTSRARDSRDEHGGTLRLRDGGYRAVNQRDGPARTAVERGERDVRAIERLTARAKRRRPNREALTALQRAERDALIRQADAVTDGEGLRVLAGRLATYLRSLRGSVETGRGMADAACTRGGGGESWRRAQPTGAGARRGKRRWERGPRGGRDRVAEARHVQRLFRADPECAVREILRKSSRHCEIPVQSAEEYFIELYAPSIGARESVPAHSSRRETPPSAESDGAVLVDPFSASEIGGRLRRLDDSAPGPDGVTYPNLRKADPGAVLLTAVFNACLRAEAVPEAWKTFDALLVHAKRDTKDLATSNLVPKLFAAALADRLTSWAIDGHRLSAAQKGLLSYEGFYEHSFVLREALDDARRRGEEIVIAWTNLSNALDSVPHAVIYAALERAGAPELFINVVRSLYADCDARVYAAPIARGVGFRQGCPLSPVLFDLTIETIVRAVFESGSGYVLHAHDVSVLAYAHHLTLLARTPACMLQMLSIAEEEARKIGSTFNPDNCATLHLGARGVLPTVFSLRGKLLRVLRIWEAHQLLDVPTGVRVARTPYDTIEAMIADLRRVDASLLAPWQKMEVTRNILLPRLDFLLRGADIRKGPLKEADKVIRSTAKKWLHLPQRASAELVYIPPSRGGCGLLPLADLADAMTVARAFGMLSAEDTVVASIARSSLERVVRRKIGRNPSEMDLAQYLSGSLDGALARDTGDTGSFWSRARMACRRSSGKLATSWRWDSERRELALECRGTAGRTVIIPLSARNQVVRRLRAAISESYLGTLLAKKDQGKVYEATSRCPVSNHFLANGSFTRFSDWRFIHRGRLDVLPLNAARRWGDLDKRCRRCGAKLETLPHVLNHCGPHAAARQKRHDEIVHRLVRASRIPGEIRVNKRVRGVEKEFAALRPDIVVTHGASKSVVIVDVAVPFENRADALVKARARKELKYAPLAESLRRNGYTVAIGAFLVGALGAWDPHNETLLRLLYVSRNYARLMRRLMISKSIAWSKNIYLQHITGVCQGPVPRSLPRREDTAISPRMIEATTQTDETQ